MKYLKLIALWIALAVPAFAANTLYTSSTGTDAGNCRTIGSPCNLSNGFAYEMSQVTPANGDVVYMCRGACDGDGVRVRVDVNFGGYPGLPGGNTGPIPSGNSWSNALTVTQYPGELVAIRHITLGRDYTQGALVQYVILRDFEVDCQCSNATADGGWSAIEIAGPNFGDPGAHHIRIQRIVAHDARDTAAGLGSGRGTHDNQYLDLTLYNMGTSAQFDHCMYLNTEWDSLVDGGNFYNCAAAAFQAYGRTDPNYDLRPYNITVRNVKLHDSLVGAHFDALNGLFYNNIIYNNTTGVDSQFGGSLNNKFYNNTFYNNTDNAIQSDGADRGHEVKNNIFWKNGATISGRFTASNSLTTDPLFVSEGGADFHIKNGSPAISAGAFSAFVSTDKDGVSRPNPPSIGAYEPASGTLIVISPSSGSQGATMNINVTGINTHFVNMTSALTISGAGVTINSTTVSSPTAAVVNITIAGGATLAFRNVTMTTGSEVVTLGNGFLVTGAPTAPTNLRTVFDPLIAVPRIAIAAEGR